MEKRLDYYPAAPKTLDRILALGSHLQREFPDAKLKALVELRVSQINGCAYCVNQHSGEARALGEAQQRLDCLPVWREVTFFTDKERAAFAWAESVTLVATTHVPDEVYAEAKAHFSDEELTMLTIVIATMNLWNRLAISFRKEVAPATV